MPFKGCLSDACVLTKNERFVLNPSAKNRTLRFKTANLSICGLYREERSPTIITSKNRRAVSTERSVKEIFLTKIVFQATKI